MTTTGATNELDVEVARIEAEARVRVARIRIIQIAVGAIGTIVGGLLIFLATH